MAGLIDSFMQGYINRVNAQNGGGRAANNTLAAQNTASAFQRLQDAISQDYSQQQAQAKAAGQEWKMPSPTERFNDQVQAMILSGDPALQERGLALMTPDAMDKPTDFQRNFEYLKQANPNLSEMEYFRMLHPGPAQTRVNVNLPKQDQPMTFEDAQKLDWSAVPGGYKPGMSMMDAGKAGARLAATKDQAETDGATKIMDTSLKGMETSPGITTKPIPAAVSELRSQPGIIGQTVNTALNVANIPQNTADVKFIADRNMYVGQLTKAMNGAGASDQERENWLRQAPQLTDSPEQRRIKLKALRDATNQFNQIAKNKGGNLAQAPKSPEAPKAPQQRVTKSGIKYTVE